MFNPRNIKIMQIKRFYSVKIKVKLDETVSNNINENAFKPRNHPGRIKITTVTVPDKLVAAIQNVAEDFSIKQILHDSESLSRHLKYRKSPVEDNEMRDIRKSVLAEFLQKDEKKEQKTDLDLERYKQSINDKVHNKLKRVVYNWAPINYDTYNSLLYLYSRFAPDYAALVKIFYEISLRDEHFRPRSLFDFGSGTGTATWAANLYWKKYFFEYFNVDSSSEMNDLALLLQQGGRGNANTNIKGTFYRQFLPANNVAYDLVVCSHSLLELPSLRSRLQTILNLWNKTTGYLVIVEQGSIAGFKVINQVRDFILNIETEETQGHVFSPCPHDMDCPRFANDSKPCSFEVSYMTLPIGGTSVLKKEKYSYVVLKKGKRSPDDPQWPRLVVAPLIRSKHAICRMCAKNGKLQEIIFTASKHTKTTYHCARSSNRGDCLPIDMESVEKETEVKICSE